jgi:hypothetical protein
MCPTSLRVPNLEEVIVLFPFLALDCDHDIYIYIYIYNHTHILDIITVFARPFLIQYS